MNQKSCKMKHFCDDSVFDISKSCYKASNRRKLINMKEMFDDL